MEAKIDAQLPQSPPDHVHIFVFSSSTRDPDLIASPASRHHHELPRSCRSEAYTAMGNMWPCVAPFNHMCSIICAQWRASCTRMCFYSSCCHVKKCQTPEIGIPPSDRATRRYTKVHLDFCLRFSTLIGHVPRFGAGPRRYIRSRLFRLAVTVFWRALTASWRQKGKRKQGFSRAIRTTELPSNPSLLTFRNNQIQILQTSSTHATMAANVSQQVTNTHGTWLSHARTHIQRETRGQKP